MIWVATENGLNRFDGNKFTTYTHKIGDKHSLSHNYVSTLFEDSKGHLFIGTYGGVQLYHPDTDTFSEIPIFEDGTPYNQHVVAIVENNNGKLLVTGHRLVEMTIVNDTLKVKKISQSDDFVGIGRMIKDKQGNIWINKRYNNLFRYNPENQTQKPYLQGKASMAQTCFYEDPKGNFYIGTQKNGLLTYDSEIDDFHFVLDSQGRAMPQAICCLFAAPSGAIYIGTDGNGLKIYNPESREVEDSQLGNIIFNPNKLKIHAILQDRNGILWLGIYQKGVMMVLPQTNNFHYIGYKSFEKNLIGSNAITAIQVDKDGCCWVGTDNDGIYKLSVNQRQSQHYAPGKEQGASPSTISKLFEDSNHKLWFGSYNQGMGWINKSTGACSYINVFPNHTGQALSVFDIIEDNQKRLWIATLGKGLLCYDLKRNCPNSTIQMPQNLNQWINCLLITSQDSLYAGTYRGAYSINIAQDSLVAKQLFNNSIVYSICQSADGTIWFGTSEGLISRQAQTGRIKTYTRENGLCGNLIYSIQNDDDGRLWLSTDRGLSCMTPPTEEFISYYASDGIQGNEFCRNASFRDSKGSLWFGGTEGVTYFTPPNINTSSKQWDIRLCNFYVYNHPVHRGIKSGKYEIMTNAVFQSKEFHLNYNDNTFSLEFSTQEFDIPSEHIAYSYRLNNDRWINLVEGNNRISFNDMAPGSYFIEVKAHYYASTANAASFVVHIHPAWWNSSWAWCLYSMALIGVIAVIVSQTLARYRAQREIRNHILEEQNKEAKLQFLINISHEIRTPMSLIISPIQKLIKNDEDSAMRKQSYQLINKNAERILQLINQLLDVRKIEKGQMQLMFKEVKMVPFIEDICENFTQLSNKRNISLTFNHLESNDLSLWIDPANFDKILLNLLSNAFKFTPEGGKVEISLQHNEKQAEIIITDTGIGLNDKEKELIFDRFYQGHTTINSSIGTGIGLHLTRSLVQLHHGNIYASNNPNGEKGCRFIIHLPIGNAHLNKEDLVLNQQEDCSPFPITPIIEETTRNEPYEADFSTETKMRSKTKYNILIVEDDEDISQYLVHELSANFHISSCHNGKEAMEQLMRQQPDIIISDIMMPEMDGITLCKKIKQHINLNHIPVILLTAKTRAEDNIEGLNVGADAYITKPFNIEILRKTIENLISSRRSLRNAFAGKQEVNDQISTPEIQSPDEKLMGRIIKTINKHLSETDLSVKTIADEVGISTVHLNRKLKELTNQTTSRFIRNIRLKAAAELLHEKKHSIAEVAEMVGFPDPNYFSTAFKELFGVYPKAYMNEGQHNNIE